MKLENKSFEGEVVTLDGNEYFKCEFEGCQLVFCGVQGVQFVSCKFGTNSWIFDGPAARTVAFMQSMYRGGATSLIEATFENIRGKTAAPGVKLN